MAAQGKFTSIAMEEYELMKDSKYRVYVSAVDKALKNFEYTSEWADLIAALGKLNKVLMSHMKFQVIPRRIKISKRLAQCMHPALPSGVHLKALETYDIIFKCMGTCRLSHELFIYSAGLFPLLGHAAMNVRPSLLTVYETHFVPLGERLGPALSGFLSGVLPGLEEGSDHYDRTNVLLEKVCEGVGAARFYTCLWDCLACNSVIRLPAVSFILAHFNKKLSMEDQLHIMGTNIDVMVCGLCAGVQDASVLVQRSALDLLLVGFPLHNSQLVRSDMVRLVTASLVTILRRDMSLNRRLFAWLLGSEVNLSLLSPEHPLVKGSPESYFQLYSREMLIQAIRTTLNQVLAETPHDLRPYRLLVSLLDKTEIGPVILDDILYEVFRTLHLASRHSRNIHSQHSGETHHSQTQSSGHQELFKSANLLFSSLEPAYIWQYAAVLLEKACQMHVDSLSECDLEIELIEAVRPVGSGQPRLIEVCQLVSCLLDTVSLETYIDTTSEHLPNLFLQVVKQVSANAERLSPRQLATCLELCAKILSRVQLQPSFPATTSSDVLWQRQKTAENGQRRSSDGSQTTISEATVDKLKDLSRSDHHLESDAGLRVETVSRSASVGARLETGPSLTGSGKPTELKKPVDTLPACALELSIPTNIPPNPILEQCRLNYQELFVCLIGGTRMIKWGSSDFHKLFCQLLIESRSEEEEEHSAGLERLLNACLIYNESQRTEHTPVKNQMEPLKSINMSPGPGCLDLHEQLQADSTEWEEVLSLACSLLVDLSTFPTFSRQPVTPAVRLCSSVSQLPSWLQLLVVCTCWLGCAPTMQLTAVSTLLDLITVACGNTLPTSANMEDAASVVTPVVLVPLLEPGHVRFLEHNTHVMQVIGRWLWRHLGSGGELEARCVTLLQQLHDTMGSSDAVEAAIGESLGQEDALSRLNAFQRFATLWHSARNITSKGRHRPFQKCLLRMLDNLALPDSSPLRLTAQGWLLHALLRGDIARLLDPLLLPLLAPATARVSVLRVSIRHRSTVLPNDSDSAEARIYAISSVDGNVIYHVSPLQTEGQRKGRSVSDPVRAKRIFTVSTLVRHCSGGGSESGIELSNSSLRSWAIPSAISGGNRLTNGEDNLSSRSSTTSNSSSSSVSGNGSMSLSGENGARSSYTRLVAPGESDPQSLGVHVSIRCDGRLVVDGPLTKRVCGGFEEGEDDDMSDKFSASGTGTSQSLTAECELEESLSAEDYFSKGGSQPRSRASSSSAGTTAAQSKSGSGVEDVLHDVLNIVAFQSNAKGNDEEPSNQPLKQQCSTSQSSHYTIHPLHSHMLLYCGVYDSGRTLYALRTLRNALATNPRTFLSCAATTGVAKTSSDLLNLLARHRKSVSGHSFLGDLANGVGGSGRSHMYLEVILSMCLYYTRSFYPSLGLMRLTTQEIEGNRQVQVASLELLTLVFLELTSIVRDSGKGLANYIADLLSRCKVQKVMLHCLVASVHDCAGNSDSSSNLTFTEEIVRFNDPGRPKSDQPGLSSQSEAFQIQLLRLLLALIILEHQVKYQKGDGDIQPSVNSGSTSSVNATSVHNTSNSSTDVGVASAPAGRKQSELKYLPGHSIPQQPMFVAAVLSALRMQGHMQWLHQHWSNLVTCALPFMGQSLAHVVLSVVRQLCENLRALTPLYDNTLSASERAAIRLPADYTVTQLEALTVLCHYCLLDRSQQPTHALNQPLLSASTTGSLTTQGQGQQGASAPSHTAQIFNNLVHVFMATPLHHDGGQESLEPQLAARRALLFNLPQIIASTATLWQAVMLSSDREREWCSVAGSARVVRHHLLEFLSPISLHHASNFLAAIAVVWQDRRCSTSSNPVTAACSVTPEQQVLVQLVGAIRVMPIDTLVQTLHQIVKSPPAVHGSSQSVSLEVSSLELLLSYLRQGGSPPLLLAESWGSVLALLRDGLQPGLPPPAQFLLLAVLNEFVQRCPSPSERRDLRDLQDITTKLVESCGSIAGACLEQTTWLRRNLAVKEDQPAPADNTSLGVNPSSALHSVQAQTVLAEQLASLLDVTFGSQEKEKVVNILTTLLYNIMPYLRNHSPRNALSFHACSELLASLTAFQYTRKAWRRDVFDLLLDPALFQMEARALPHWRAIIDNLMTHDSATFRDLMGRVTLGQGNSLSLFSSREQEYEQRAQLLKRLAFVILCSEMDQYHKYMPEIQERLAESLRLPQVVPAVQANVFLCFRVLLLRMSPHHVTSLWPVIISEMVQVFLQMEQELSTDSEEFSSHIRLMSGLDLTWVSDRSNGLHARGHPHWLQLQLAAAQLLHLALQLPAHRLPQFQMYRWAFVGSMEPTGLNNNNSGVLITPLAATHGTPDEEVGRSPHFVPHVTRIARLMDAKFEGPVELPIGSALLPGTQAVRCLQELHPFFSTLSASGGLAFGGIADTPQALAELERVIEADFLEPMPTR